MLFSGVGLLLTDLSDAMVQGALCFLYLLFWICQPIQLAANVDWLFRTYLLMKTVANACMAVSVAILLFLLRVDMWPMFALLAFILNYIPEIGPLVSILCPIPVIMLDGRHTVGQRVINMLIATLGQLAFKFLFGNVLELKLIEHDRKMRMHPVIILLSVAFFGYLWGPTGMLISVPVMAMLKLVCLDDNSPFDKSLRNGVLIFLEADVNAPFRDSNVLGNSPRGLRTPRQNVIPVVQDDCYDDV